MVFSLGMVVRVDDGAPVAARRRGRPFFLARRRFLRRDVKEKTRDEEETQDDDEKFQGLPFELKPLDRGYPQPSNDDFTAGRPLQKPGRGSPNQKGAYRGN